MVDANREGLHQGVMLLREALENGRISVAPHLIDGFRENCEKIKLADDGLVIPETVNPSIRNAILMLSWQKERQELKNQMPLIEIQRIYFEIIEKNFGSLYVDMKKEKKLNPHLMALAMSKSKEVEKTSLILEGFYSGLHQFWQEFYDIANIHVEDLMSLKGVYGGDLFPSYTKNIASTCGLYIDTIILPDPLMKTAQAYKYLNHEKRVYFAIKQGLNVLQYKELALTEIDPPILVVLPEKHFFEKGFMGHVNESLELDTVKHANRLFNTNFSSTEELEEFLKNFETPHKLAQVIHDPSRLLFDIEHKGSSEELINAHLIYYKEMLNNEVNIQHAGQAVIANIRGRMEQANKTLKKGFELRGVPIIEAPTSWKYFNWKLEYDAKSPDMDNEKIKQLHITKALQNSAETKLQWLGNIPPDVLIKMRKDGFADEFRQITSNGFEQIIDISESGFNKTTNQVIANIENMFSEHNSKLKKLSRDKLKFYSADYLSFLAVGGISLAAAFFPSESLALLTAVANMYGAPRICELYGKAKEIDEKSQTIRYSPVGMLFEHASK